ncbi:3-oxoacyl-ACP reductase [Endozoicomonas sp. (ex Bugula neritina AB1)]|nr:3-oxoacyl-ACP reductase [Endozoicomonas sp. (ex Bugula neritina AB1)]
MDINDKNIVITGAARGLGKAIALLLAKRKANITLLDLDSEDLHNTARDIEKLGVKALPIPTDVTSETQVVASIKKASDTLGAIHGLINNAGILQDGLLVKSKEGKIISTLSYDQWQSVINVNLTGVFLCGREVAANMIELGTKGVIINITSISRAGNFGQSNYAAAKAGVVALTTTWSKELARYGIRSTAIAPGMIATEMTGSMKPEALDKMNAAVPAGRMGTPEEIAKTAAFILENDYFNGRVLELDGGLRL